MKYTNNTTELIPYIYLSPFNNYVVRSDIPPGMHLTGLAHDLPGQLVAFTDPKFEGILFIFTLGNFVKLTVEHEVPSPERADEGGSRRDSCADSNDTQFTPTADEL